MKSTKENARYDENINIKPDIDIPWTSVSNTTIEYALDRVELAKNTKDNHVYSKDNIGLNTYLNIVYQDNTIDKCKVVNVKNDKTNLFNNTYANEINTNEGGLTGTVTTGNKLYSNAAHDKPTLFTVGNTMYSCGGIGPDSQVTDIIMYAKIVNNVVGTWKRLTINLPIPLINFNVVGTEDNIYIMGGTNITGNVNRNIYIGKLDSEGIITEWSLSNILLPNFISKQIPIISGNKISLIGGYDSNNDSDIDTIYTSTINPNGNIGAWIISPTTLPYPLNNETPTIVKDNTFYIFGNNVDADSTDKMYVSEITNNVISSFTMHDSIFQNGATTLGSKTYIYNNTMYIFSDTMLTKISKNLDNEYVVVNSNEIIDYKINNNPVINYSTIMHNGKLYFIGGTSTEVSKNIRYLDFNTSIDAHNTLLDPTVCNIDTRESGMCVIGDTIFKIGGIKYKYDNANNGYVDETPVNLFISKAVKNNSGFISGWENTDIEIGTSNIVYDTIVIKSNIYVIVHNTLDSELTIHNINASNLNMIYLEESIVIDTNIVTVHGSNLVHHDGTITAVYYTNNNGIRLSDYTVNNDGALTTIRNNINCYTIQNFRYTSGDRLKNDSMSFTKDNITYFMGGYDDANEKYSDEIKYVYYDSDYGNVNTHIFKLPEPMSGASIVLSNDTLYLMGGSNISGVSDKIYRCTIKSNTFTNWELLGTRLSYGVTKANTVVTDNYIYIYNGYKEYEYGSDENIPSNSVIYLNFGGWNILANQNIMDYYDNTISGLTKTDKPMFVYYHSDIDIEMTYSQTENSYNYLSPQIIDVTDGVINERGYFTSLTVVNNDLFIGEEITLNGYITNILSIDNVDGKYKITINPVHILEPDNVVVKKHQYVNLNGNSTDIDRFYLTGDRNSDRIIVGDKVVINNNTYREILSINEIDLGNGIMTDEFIFASVTGGVTSFSLISKTQTLRVISKTYKNGIFRNKYNSININGYVVGRSLIASNDKVDIQIPFISELYI